MGRSIGAGATVEIELQSVVHADGKTGLRRALAGGNRRDLHFGELVFDAFAADRGMRAVKRLKATGKEAGGAHNDAKPHGGEPCGARSCAMVTPPH